MSKPEQHYLLVVRLFDCQGYNPARHMPRQCCKYKRSPNDALLDSENGETYCGTCWQAWLKSRPKSQAAPIRPTPEAPGKEACSSEKEEIIADDKELGELEGVPYSDGTLYLVSRLQRLVFHASRSESGHLRCAGVLVHNVKTGKDILKLHSEIEKPARDEFPFKAQPEDHCETPFEAYADLAPYLGFLAEMLGKDRTSLRVWDPYYCAGNVKRNLRRLGFSAIHNECEDFYSIVGSSEQPPHDCIITNPPYSTEPVDHVERLVKILCKQRKPWFVVQPNYVYIKPFWEEYTKNLLLAPRPFFLTPSVPRKYKYKTPTGLRDVRAQQLKTSPFISMWYCWLGPQHTERMYRWIARQEAVARLPLSLACTEYCLPDSFKDSNDKTRRKQRKGKKRSASSETLLGKGSSPESKRSRKRGR